MLIILKLHSVCVCVRVGGYYTTIFCMFEFFIIKCFVYTNTRNKRSNEEKKEIYTITLLKCIYPKGMYFLNRKRKDNGKTLTLNFPLEKSANFSCKELDSRYLWLGQPTWQPQQ